MHTNIVFQSCPTILLQFSRDATNPREIQRLVLGKRSEKAAFCRQILRFREFRDAANVVNNLKYLAFDWLRLGGVSLPLKIKQYTTELCEKPAF